MRTAPTTDRVLPSKWSSRALLGRSPLVLSFDIFGFALEPTVLVADDIHRLVASHLGDDLGLAARSRRACYPAMRELAEDRARAEAAEGGSGGVIAMPAVRGQLAELLGAAGWGIDGPTVARAAIRREIDLHRDIWRANPVAHELYRDALTAGISVAFLADSPLPRDLVTRVLHDAGYRRGTVLVSSQEGATKASGALYATLEDRSGVEPDRITHLGPDQRADGDRPSERRLQVWPASAERAAVVHQVATGLVERTGVDAVALALAADRLAAAGQAPTATDLGYYAGGPLAVGFCGSVVRSIAVAEPDHVVFCGPAGRLLRQVTSILFPDLHIVGRSRGDGGRVLAVGLGWDDQPHRWLGPLSSVAGDQIDLLSALLSSPRAEASHRLAAGVIEFARDVAPLLAELPDDLSPALAEPALRVLDTPTAAERALLAVADDRWPDVDAVRDAVAEHPLSRWRRRPPARRRSRPPTRDRRA